MKAVLAFTLPEEADEHQVALQGAEWRGVVAGLDEWLRARIKYEVLPNVKEVALEEVREKLREELAGRGLSLEY